MEAIQNAVSCSCPNDLSASRSLYACQTQLAAVTSSQSMDLELLTEEGDKVTLSIDAQASAVYAAHGAVVADDDELYGQWGEFSGGAFEREVDVTVDGDLNQQERREIRKVIRTLNRIMNDFVQDRLNPMISKARQLQGLKTIDSLEVEMSYERQVLIAQQAEAAVAYDRTGEVAAASAAPGSMESVDLPIVKEAEVVAADMAGEVVSARTPLDPLKELADRLLQAYHDRSEEWNPLAGRVIDHIHDVFHAIVGGTEEALERDTNDSAVRHYRRR
ncbi:MAG: hypothetical protein P8X96_00950 [Desulfobacteraceae bacterium]